MKKLLSIAFISASLAANASPRIYVQSGSKRIELTKYQVCLLYSTGINSLNGTLNSYKTGGTIRNNEAADMIFKILEK